MACTLPLSPARAQSASWTTPGSHSYTVPPGIDRVVVILRGAGGGGTSAAGKGDRLGDDRLVAVETLLRRLLSGGLTVERRIIASR